jgi:uncharacterized protein with HEPN domain
MSRDKASLQDIIDSCSLALRYLGSKTVDELKADQEKVDAIVRWIGIVGEAAKRLSKPFCQTHSQIPWRLMAGMRDILVHDYDQVDVARVHSAVTKQMPELLDQLKRIIDSLPDPE